MRFDPRPREGSDDPPLMTAIDSIVSIHAPVKGATLFAQDRDEVLDVSIHAPVKGATLHQ